MTRTIIANMTLSLDGRYVGGLAGRHELGGAVRGDRRGP
jgi:hypothetical protein